MSATFQLQGQTFLCAQRRSAIQIHSGNFVFCELREEVDDLWEKLSAGGREDRCGWLQDKYGLSWQIIPKGFGRDAGGRGSGEGGVGDAGHAANGED
jgi:predicted 3-demethylubiquinone-9 3-methyltransferase (glyoxalase superfamily)